MKLVKLVPLVSLVLLVLLLPLVVINLKQKTQPRGKAAGNFQPSPPYYATFFYPWYQNPNTDGLWSGWNDLGHTPPQNWFSQYLPDPNPSAFDPATELYSSRNDQIIYWQLRKLAEAKQTIAITSWWGQGHKTDVTFNHIITDVMNRLDNPYPNLRWAVYYEKEGFGNPPLSELVNDLNYIKTKYTNQPGYLKINGKPVVLVYNAAHAGSNSLEDLSRWKQARAQTGFYVAMKIDPLNSGANPADMDGWAEYAPAAAHYQTKPPYYSFVSPGFWLNGQAERLTRDSAAFEAGVKQMVASQVAWKLTETWNEWGEGSGVEPADQVNQTTAGPATLKQGGYPFKNLYVDILNRNLPPLPQGTGAGQPTSPPASTGQPTNPPNAADPVIVAAGDIACGSADAGKGFPCQHQATANLIQQVNPDAVLPLGDNQYESGALSDFESFYGPSWGRFKAKTKPVIGNHEGGEGGSSAGYFDYFNGVGQVNGPAGPRDKGYYSYDLGAWHFIALNANCGKYSFNGTNTGCNAGSAQEQWLKADLAANSNKCTLAYWHQPQWSSGHEGDPTISGTYSVFWQDLYNAHATIVLNGHSHDYERFAPQDPSGKADPNGIREFVVGTGGRDFTGFNATLPNSEVRNNNTFGVLQLTLHPTSYDWKFVPIAGQSFTDSGSGKCLGVPGTTPTGPITPTYVCGGSPTSICPTPTPTTPPNGTPVVSDTPGVQPSANPSAGNPSPQITDTLTGQPTQSPNPNNEEPDSGEKHKRVKRGEIYRLIQELLKLINELLGLLRQLR